MKKTIIFSMLIIMLFGMFAANYTRKTLPGTRIVIEPVNQTISSELLNQSAVILANRLKLFSDRKFELKLSPLHHQIEVILSKGWDVKTAERLLTQQGSFGFYETYNQAEFMELLPARSLVLSKLNQVDHPASSAIGCASASNVETINKQLTNEGIDQKCKLVWSSGDEGSLQCLYALKWSDNHQALLTSGDCDGLIAVPNESGNAELRIQFNKQAGEQWKEITARNMNRSVAIVMDNQILASPIVRSVITGGGSSVTGNFTLTEVKTLAALASCGELPVLFKQVK